MTIKIKIRSLTLGDLSVDICRVPSGIATVGSTFEGPVTHVPVNSPYWLGRTPVTQSLYYAVMGSNPSTIRGEMHPVETVSRRDCEEFCCRLSKILRLNVRLPHEFEWEHACNDTKSRGKPLRRGELNQVAWYSGNSHRTTHPVGLKSPNKLGLCDMLGNVFEWCSNGFGDYVGGDSEVLIIEESQMFGVLRGGSFMSVPSSIRPSARFMAWMEEGEQVTEGFRILVEDF